MARGLLTIVGSQVRPRSAALVGVKAMMFALGAATSLLDSLQALTASNSSSASSSTQSQTAANPFDLGASTQTSATPTTGFSQGTSGFSAISPQTMSALLDAQSQSGTTSSTTTSPSDALQNLFNDIDTNGDGSITKSEFESALGAGGTNVANADKVFGELDSNGDGSVSLDELKSALQGAGHHGGHHMHASGSGDSSADGSGGDASSNPLLQALAGASSTSATNSDGSTTTTITYADGSKVSLTTPAASTTSSTSSTATSSYNLIEQMIQREAKALSTSLQSSLSVSA